MLVGGAGSRRCKRKSLISSPSGSSLRKSSRPTIPIATQRIQTRRFLALGLLRIGLGAVDGREHVSSFFCPSQRSRCITKENRMRCLGSIRQIPEPSFS